MPQTKQLYELLLECARTEGFPLVNALDLDSVGDVFPKHVARFDQWLAQGHDAEMGYLKRGRDRRADPRQVLPDAQSILCVAIPYEANPAGRLNPKDGPRYARYLRRQDYHEDIAARLERVMKRVIELYSSKLTYKVCVDTSAVLERSWAALAGLGWIGKNTLLIHPQLGSYLFLGEVLLSEKVGQGPQPLPNYCGNCTRCLTACPTKALIEPGTLKSNQCIAYWTLEKRGKLSLSEDDKDKIGTWIAGCDICQEVCPFNTKATNKTNNKSEKQPDSPLLLSHWVTLLEESTAAYQERVKHSALSRVKPAQFSRNLALTLANAIELNDLAWARSLQTKVQFRYDQEADESAKLEWQRVLNRIESIGKT